MSSRQGELREGCLSCLLTVSWTYDDNTFNSQWIDCSIQISENRKGIFKVWKGRKDNVNKTLSFDSRLRETVLYHLGALCRVEMASKWCWSDICHMSNIQFWRKSYNGFEHECHLTSDGRTHLQWDSTTASYGIQNHSWHTLTEFQPLSNKITVDLIFLMFTEHYMDRGSQFKKIQYHSRWIRSSCQVRVHHTSEGIWSGRMVLISNLRSESFVLWWWSAMRQRHFWITK